MLLCCSRIKHYGDDLRIPGLFAVSYTSAAHVEVVLSFDSVCDGTIDVHDNRPHLLSAVIERQK
jgi:hypothetical protein